ncbi:MAG: hypothetical protein KBT27_15360 [Prevotellaceae bacterium]|nr:hypothetical protein [Candidatus Faecinaster equi]
MKDKKFIMVNDELTANQLIKAGFTVLSKNSGVYMFINNPPMNFKFDSINIHKIAFTNILSL